MINTKKTVGFQNVNTEDFAEILELEKSTFNEYDMMNSDDLVWYLEKYGRGFYKILESGVFAGYILFFVEDGEGYMESIAIDRRFRGRGIADAAINFMIRQLMDENISVLKLHVRKENASAIELYKKHGFIQAGIEDGIYADGATALVYSKALR